MSEQSIFEQFNSGVESIFATIGNASDGAISILGDYIELEELLNHEENQGSSAFENYFTWGTPTQQQSSTAPVISTPTSNSNMLIYAAFGLVGVGALSLLLGK